jgi:hypothetical protein
VLKQGFVALMPRAFLYNQFEFDVSSLTDHTDRVFQHDSSATKDIEPLPNHIEASTSTSLAADPVVHIHAAPSTPQLASLTDVVIENSGIEDISPITRSETIPSESSDVHLPILICDSFKFFFFS